MNSKAIEILQSKNYPHGAIFLALTGDRGKLCHGTCTYRDLRLCFPFCE